jgi:hypothetical protein
MSGRLHRFYTDYSPEKRCTLKNGYVIPQHDTNEKGEQRTIGFELEFGDLEVDRAVAVVTEAFSGSFEKKSEVEFEVTTEELGVFKVELDWQLGKKIAEKRAGTSLSDGDLEPDAVMDWIKKIAGQLVPVEIVCPPLSLEKCQHLDILVDILRAAGAKGTDESYLYAFGVHINPEITDSSPQSIARYLQAFGLTQDWLFEINRVDPMRRVTPYINTFGSEYLDLIFQYTENITIRTMIEDYMEHNSTRNRALDMLPLWNHLEEDFLGQFELNDSLTQARPTFHYRLPNCEIEKEGWYLSESWNIWCVVEYIAANKDVLERLITHRQQSKEKNFLVDDKQWHSELEKIYHDLLSE